MAAVSAASCAGSRYPIRSPRAVFEIVTILSQFTTESWPMPLACPTGISTDRPRVADVTGATVIRGSLRNDQLPGKHQHRAGHIQVRDVDRPH